MQRAFTSLIFSCLPLATFSCLIPLSTQAQITPDGTTSTTVNQDGNNFAIEQGDRIGDNLFHSFDEFSVPTQGSAVFNNAGDIANIFSRVTGNSISNIDGMLGANGTANLYLINPNGIIFGQNARLDLGGSFFASTADSLLFEGDTEFSAVNPQAPSLLEVSIPIGARFRDNLGDIVVRGNGQGTRLSSNLIDTNDALRVDSDKTFALAGGNLIFEGATIKTAGGRIELGSVEENEQIGITSVNEGFSLNFEEVQNFRDIQFSQVATIDASGENGGDIKIYGNNINLTGTSQIESSILANSTSPGNGGVISVNVTGTLNINGSNAEGTPSGIFGNVYTTSEGESVNINISAGESVELHSGGNIQALVLNSATGNAGNITFNATSLIISDGSLVSSTTFGRGNAGNISIQTENIDISNNSDSLTGIFAFVNTDATGDGGQININSDNLNVSNENSFISVSTLGQGDAGIINIAASDSINVNNGADIWAIVFESGIGNGGTIDIETSNLEVKDFSKISGESFGQGSSGKLTVNADVIKLRDRGQIIGSIEGKGEGGNLLINTETIEIVDSFGSGTFRPTGILSNINRGGEGNGGNIDITAKNISLDGSRAEISASAFGEGNAGELSVTATESIDITSSSGIFADIASTDITGVGGNLIVDTPNLSLSRGGIISVDNTGNGDAGVLTINTDSLNITDGGEISGDVFGMGNGADIFINAKNIKLDDLTTPQTQNRTSLITGISADLGFEANGNGGNVTIATEQLKISGSNSQISVSTNDFALGDAGVLNINSSESIVIEGTGENTLSNGAGLFANVFDDETLGNSGLINIETPFLFLNQGIISINNQGQGNGGELFIDANSIKLKNNSQIIAETVNSSGGNANLTVEDTVILQNNSIISARAFKKANGGNLTIDANDGFILAFPNQNNDIVASAEEGNGGNIKIFTQAIFGLEERSSTPPNQTNDIDASSEFGLQGDFSLNTPDFDPTTGLINLPASVGDASDRISQNPCQQGVGSEFIVTGKGGLPPSVSESLNSEPTGIGLIEPLSGSKQSVLRDTSLDNEETGRRGENAALEALPAQGWIFNNKGEVTLIAHSTSARQTQRPKLSDSSSCKI